MVVRRSINNKNNTSTWLLNGKQSIKSTVEAEVGRLDVQVGNLCSFLPQDRVNEFAKLKPEELLVETQKVAGHKNLKDWHDKLIDLGNILKGTNEVPSMRLIKCNIIDVFDRNLQQTNESAPKKKEEISFLKGRWSRSTGERNWRKRCIHQALEPKAGN
jgi:hypothetical protein